MIHHEVISYMCKTTQEPNRIKPFRFVFLVCITIFFISAFLSLVTTMPQAYAIICAPAPCIGFNFPGGYTPNDAAKIDFNNSADPADTTDGTINKIQIQLT